MRKGNEEWVKKCMEYRVEGRDRLEDQERHGWRVYKRIWPNLRSTKKMSMIEVNGEGM